MASLLQVSRRWGKAYLVGETTDKSFNPKGRSDAGHLVFGDGVRDAWPCLSTAAA